MSSEPGRQSFAERTRPWFSTRSPGGKSTRPRSEAELGGSAARSASGSIGLEENKLTCPKDLEIKGSPFGTSTKSRPSENQKVKRLSLNN